MANDGVNIPVRVTGDDEAKQKLRAVGESVEGVGKAGDAAGGGLEQPGKQAETSGRKVEGFSRDAKQALGGLLDLAAPGFSQLLNLVTDVAVGITKVGASLLAMAGAAAAVGAVVALMRQMATAAEDARREVERVRGVRIGQREGAQALRERVQDAFLDAGVGVAGESEARAVAELGRTQGIEEDVATFGVIAGQLGGLSDAERQSVMAAFVAGGRSARFEGSAAAKKAMIARMVQAGREPGAQQAFRNFLAGRAARVRGDAVPENAFATEDSRLDDATRRVASDEALADSDAAMLRRLAGDGLFGDRSGDLTRQSLPTMFGPITPTVHGPDGAVSQVVFPGDAGVSVQRMIELVRRVRDIAAQAAAGGPPVILNITNNNNSTHVGNQFNGGERRDRMPSPDFLLPGE